MNERFQRSIAEGTSKDDSVFGIWMHCWHEPEVTQLLTDLVANWALWTRPAWRVSFPVVAVCAVWLVAACFFSCTAVGRAGCSLRCIKEHNCEREQRTFVWGRFTEKKSSWKCCSLCDVHREPSVFGMKKGIAHFLCVWWPYVQSLNAHPHILLVPGVISCWLLLL